MYLNEANCYNLLLFDCVRRTNMHGVEILHNEHTKSSVRMWRKVFIIAN